MAKARGADREQFWRRAFERRADSGMTIPQFCAREGLKVTSYYYWRRALKRRDAAFQTAKLDEAPGLVPLEVVEDHNCTAPVEIVVNQRLVIRVSEEATSDHLRRVLEVVAELG